MVTIKSIVFLRSMACMTLGDERKVWLTRSDFLESGWREGSSVERKLFDHFIQIHQYPHAMNQAVSMLTRRPCSKGEILQSLSLHHYFEDVIAMVICRLEKEDLLNDQEFSELWVQQRCKKFGIRRIRQELRLKGVPEPILNMAISQISDEQMMENAIALAVKAWSKIKPGEDLRKSRQKIISCLVRKGFDWETSKLASDAAEKRR